MILRKHNNNRQVITVQNNILVSMLFVLSAAATLAQAQGPIPALAYAREGRQLQAIPVPEQNLPTITAQQWFKVSDKGLQLEGPSFDRDGNLLFVEVFGGQVLKLDT